jgi:DNA-directed RNA polymerase specialized sigma24 family protein
VAVPTPTPKSTRSSRVERFPKAPVTPAPVRTTSFSCPAKNGRTDAYDQLCAATALRASQVLVYFLLGGDADDLMQEGMLGLFKAIRTIPPERESSFRGFAELCITRQIITA